MTALLEKLPKRLSHPILKELTPIREIFLEQRPARLMLLGKASPAVPELLKTWYGLETVPGVSRQGWQSYSLPDQGILQVLDAREDCPENLFQAGITSQQPDITIIWSTITQNELSRLSACDYRTHQKCPILILGFNESQGFTLPAEFRNHEVRMLSSETTAATSLCELLPNAAKLEMARVLKVKDAQHQIAHTLLHSFSATCGVIGMQPLPLADLPILISLQSFMVGIIAYCSGRHLQVKTIAEFLSAVGLNVGAGMLFREGARTVIRFLPFWGNAVSGFVAGTGTYIIGKAAIAYFIDQGPETPANAVHKIFENPRRQSLNN